MLSLSVQETIKQIILIQFVDKYNCSNQRKYVIKQTTNLAGTTASRSD